MNKKVFLVMVFIAGLAGMASSQSYVIVSGNTLTVNSRSNLMVDYDLSTYDSNLEQGEKGTLTLVIRNTGTQTASNVELDIPDTGAIRVGKKFYLGSISMATPVSVSVPYLITENAVIGPNTIPVSLEYDGSDSEGNSVNNIRANYDFPIKVYGNPKLTIKSLDIGKAVIGGTVTARITIVNQKAPAYNAVARLTPYGNLVTIIGADKYYIGGLDTNQPKELTYTGYISDKTESGAYTIPLTIEYENKGHTKYNETFNLGIYVSGEPKIALSNVKTDPEDMNEGDENVEVKVTVENTGTMEVKNLRITMKSQDPLRNAKSYLQTKEIGMLRPSNGSTAAFYMDVADGTAAGAYDLKFLLEYQVGTVNVNETKVVQIVVKDSPNFELSAGRVEVVPGQTGAIDLKVLNTGKKCDSVTVWAMKKSDQPFDFTDKSEYIGDLDTGRDGQAVLEFTVNQDAKLKDYILPLEIRCTLDDKVYTSSESALVTVNGRQKSNSMLYAAMIAVGLIVLYVAYKILGKILLKTKPAGKRGDVKDDGH